MIKEQFLGRCPSHFQINPLVKAFIISESFIWSAWNFIVPIFSIYIVTEIHGGTIQIAATAYSSYLVARVLFELVSGRYLVKTTDRKKIIAAIFGLYLVTLGYIAFIISSTITHVYFGYSLIGMGMGIAAPAKMSLFSMHLDKNKEASEWGIADGTQFFCMAIAASLGGFIAMHYSFIALFIISAIINVIGVIPYTFFVFARKHS